MRPKTLAHAKLSPSQVRDIRANADGLTDREWSAALRVSVTTVRGVRSGQRYRERTR